MAIDFSKYAPIGNNQDFFNRYQAGINTPNGYTGSATIDTSNTDAVQKLLALGVPYQFVHEQGSNAAPGADSKQITFYGDAPTLNSVLGPTGLTGGSMNFAAPEKDNWLDKNIYTVAAALMGGAALSGLGGAGAATGDAGAAGAASGGAGFDGTTIGAGQIGNAAGIGDGWLMPISGGVDAGAADAAGAAAGSTGAQMLAPTIVSGAAPGLTAADYAAILGGGGALAGGAASGGSASNALSAPPISTPTQTLPQTDVTGQAPTAAGTDTGSGLNPNLLMGGAGLAGLGMLGTANYSGAIANQNASDQLAQTPTASTDPSLMSSIGDAFSSAKPYLGTIASLANGVMGANAAQSAANTQSAAAKYAADLANSQYQQSRTDMLPWLNAGTGALGSLTQRLGTSADNGTGNYGSLLKPFTGADLQNEPGYQFGLAEGNKQLQSQLGRGGSVYGGNALKAIDRYGQDYAGTKYNDAYQRYNTDQGNTYNRLAGVAGTGQTASSYLGGLGASNASNVGGLVTSGAAANAAGTVGAANAYGNAFTQGASSYNNYLNNQNQNALLSRILGQGGY
jgi:hypothetical protein